MFVHALEYRKLSNKSVSWTCALFDAKKKPLVQQWFVENRRILAIRVQYCQLINLP